MGVSNADGTTLLPVRIDSATNRIICSATIASGSGITSLNGLTGATQTFADVDDTNVTLTISSSGTTHTFTMGWTSTLSVARGGTATASYTKGDILVASAATTLTKLAVGANGTVLTADSAETTGTKWATVTASPGGSDTQVQFNDSGSLGGDAGMVYNKTTDRLTVAGDVLCEQVHIEDTNASHYLVITAGSDLTADRVLTFTTGDAARTVTLSGALTIAADFITSGANSLTLTTTGTTDVTFPTTGTLVTLAGTGALSNKTIGNTNTVTLKDTLFTIQDDGDATKLLAFQLSGITTGTTRTITMPDASGTVTLLGNASTGSGSVVLATSPTLVTPTLGVATATSINKVTITAPTTSATLTLVDGSSLITVGANAITFTSTGATGVTLPTTGTLATLAGTETLSNKTLTAPKFADLGFIADANGNELIIMDTVASAVNEITLANGATGNNATITASGETNAGITITGKGTKGVLIGNAALETVVALTDGATPALDASLGNVFTLSAAGNRTIAVPSNATSGQKIIIRHLASVAARTLALNTGAGGFKFGSDITALTETASGKYDYIGCIYNAVTSLWDVVAYVKGY